MIQLLSSVKSSILHLKAKSKVPKKFLNDFTSSNTVDGPIFSIISPVQLFKRSLTPSVSSSTYLILLASNKLKSVRYIFIQFPCLLVTCLYIPLKSCCKSYLELTSKLLLNAFNRSSLSCPASIQSVTSLLSPNAFNPGKFINLNAGLSCSSSIKGGFNSSYIFFPYCSPASPVSFITYIHEYNPLSTEKSLTPFNEVDTYLLFLKSEFIVLASFSPSTVINIFPTLNPSTTLYKL